MDGGLDRQKLARMTAKSAAVRAQRKQLREAIKDGLYPWERVLKGNSPWEPAVKTMRLDKLLLMIPGVGEGTMLEAVEELNLWTGLKLGGLSYELRAILANRLSGALAGEPVPPPPAPGGE